MTEARPATPRSRIARSVRLLLPALLVWLVFVALAATETGRRIEALGFDFASTLSAPAELPAPVVIVGIDEPSFAELDRQWPWPRSLHAQLIERLSAEGARVIAFDVLFAEPSTPAEDEALAAAIRAADAVVLASDLVHQDEGAFQMIMEVQPIAPLRDAGAVSGLASISFDPDLVVRRIPQHADSLWRQVAALYRGQPGTRETGSADAGHYARYYGPAHRIPYVSYYQALEPQTFLPENFFAGKIVFVGQDVKAVADADTHRGDMHATPWSALNGKLTPGVELHATFVANALGGESITRAANGLPALLSGVLLVLATLLARDAQVTRNGLLAAALVLATLAGAFIAFAVYRYWLPVLLPVLALVVLYTVQNLQAFLSERNRRRLVEKAFRHYVAPEVVREMTAHPERLVLGGARREITLMFTDLAGFTTLSETMSPERVAALLNEHMTQMTQIVLAHGGTVDKFIGDAIMAFWGAPLDDPDQALHACRAAWAMQVRMHAMQEEHAAAGLPRLSMRTGLHSGIAVVGNMGSQDRFDYTAIGDNVNLASRVEGINKLYGTATLVTEATAAQLAGRLPLRRVDRVIVKGKTRGIDIFTFCDDNDVIALSERAFDHYRNRRWADALQDYAAILARSPQDSVAGVFIKRIGGLQENPPAADWDGSTALEKM